MRTQAADAIDRGATALAAGLVAAALVGFAAFMAGVFIIQGLGFASSGEPGGDDDFGLIVYPLGGAVVAGAVGGILTARWVLRRIRAN